MMLQLFLPLKTMRKPRKTLIALAAMAGKSPQKAVDELKPEFGSESWVNNQLKAFAREFDQDEFTPFPSIDYAFDCIMATTEELDTMGHIRFLQILNEKIEKELASIFRREG